MDRRTGLLIAATSVVTIVVYNVVRSLLWPKKKREESVNTLEIRPPFPPEIIQVLMSSVLCYLSTLSDGAPHLSLMNFTYCAKDEKIIMSTRRDTTKFRALSENKRVAVLIHDFPSEHRGRAAAASAKAAGTPQTHAQTYSVTLYGNVKVESGADAERYRAAHLKRNGPNQKQFIVGDNIAIITVLVDLAKICNQADQVHVWTSQKSM